MFLPTPGKIWTVLSIALMYFSDSPLRHAQPGKELRRIPVSDSPNVKPNLLSQCTLDTEHGRFWMIGGAGQTISDYRTASSRLA